MKTVNFLYVISFLIGLFVFSCSPNQNNNEQILGKWAGVLKTPKYKLLIRPEFYVDSNDNVSLKITGLYKKKNYPVFSDSLVIDNNKLEFYIKNSKVKFNGIYVEDSNKIRGIWQQGKFRTPIVFYTEKEIYRIERPQHPFPPFPYTVDTVSFINKKDSIRLEGIITHPIDTNKKFPAVLLLSGTGPHDRDETMYRHKPFLVLGDYLTRNGFAVLRYDDRGVGGSSGNYYNSSVLDFAEDAKAAINYMKSLSFIDTSNIGIIGFGEGGVVGTIVASDYDHCNYLILLSTPAMSGKKILFEQIKRIQTKENAPEKEIMRDIEFNKKMIYIILHTQKTEVITKKLKDLYFNYIKTLSEDERMKPKYNRRVFEKQLKIYSSPWFKNYLRFNPLKYFLKLSCNTLVLYGENDLQINPTKNLNVVMNILGKNKKIKKIKISGKILQGLNHLLQKSKTGLPGEYKKNEQTLSPSVLNEILFWIKSISNH